MQKSGVRQLTEMEKFREIRLSIALMFNLVTIFPEHIILWFA
ncbi:hypothetical protein GTGU_03572 [Trabulsiella guamensis ATCC 49490]|uniref:Uncharacterized protein n=1 Tax=Trabulsiella guamensis ATCC 49490 TaxID=1005994 RepID=A0A084ZUB0_9ENTR|nr:hypothetical protein GTGU_03572 [Trabulsiella guamensis ATCC 49490]